MKYIKNLELNEANKFKPGDMWSNDFDYDGMLKFALTVNEKTPIKKLNQLAVKKTLGVVIIIAGFKFIFS